MTVNVLYVDDEGNFLDITRKLLEAEGIEVVTTASVSEALAFLRQKGPCDVIVSDYMMPENNGIDFLKAIRRENINIPFILVTGNGDEEVAIEALNNGAKFYVKKRAGSKLFADLISKIRAAAKEKEMFEHLENSRKTFRLLFGISRHNFVNQLQAVLAWMELYQCPEKVFAPIRRMQSLLEETKRYADLGEEMPTWISIKDILAELAKVSSLEIVDKTDGFKILTEKAILTGVFETLADNTQRHGGKEVTRMTISAMLAPEGDGSAYLVFEDNGCGVPIEEKRDIFKMGVGKHTGLGLHFSRELLRIVGMSIKENGIPGKGARFQIEIPKNLYIFE
jgi:CheY-like chemotaxis protein